jgi:hypothetical protein
MVVLALLSEPPMVTKILRHLGLPRRVAAAGAGAADRR